MSLVKLNYSNLDGYLLVMMAPSLPDNSRYLTVTNYTSGARWVGSPKPPGMFLPLVGVKFIALGNSYFALTSTDEGITKYLSVDSNNGGSICATSSRMTENEIFSLYTECENIDKNRFYLATSTGKFVTMVKSIDEFGDTSYEAAANSYSPDFHMKLGLYAVIRPDDSSAVMFS